MWCGLLWLLFFGLPECIVVYFSLDSNNGPINQKESSKLHNEEGHMGLTYYALVCREDSANSGDKQGDLIAA